MAKINCLVIGARGQVAQSLRRAENPGVEVVTLGRPDLDLTRPETILAQFHHHKPDIVINAAAYTHVDKAEDEAQAVFAINAQGPEALARICAENALPLVHYSTDYVFDGAGEQAWAPEDYPAPLGVYGRSKADGEAHIRATLTEHIILRTSWVFSPYGKNFVKTIISLAQERDTLQVVNDQFGSPSYAPDIAAATLKIAQQLQNAQPKYGIYHLTNSGVTNWFEFAVAAIEEAQKYVDLSCSIEPVPSEAYPTKAERPKNSRLDISSTEEVFAVTMPSWRDALSRCVTDIFESNNS